jgi:hypothetical protein
VASAAGAAWALVAAKGAISAAPRKAPRRRKDAKERFMPRLLEFIERTIKPDRPTG